VLKETRNHNKLVEKHERLAGEHANLQKKHEQLSKAHEALKDEHLEVLLAHPDSDSMSECSDSDCEQGEMAIKLLPVCGDMLRLCRDKFAVSQPHVTKELDNTLGLLEASWMTSHDLLDAMYSSKMRDMSCIKLVLLWSAAGGICSSTSPCGGRDGDGAFEADALRYLGGRPRGRITLEMTCFN